MKYVYMLRAGEQHYKVGVASNIVNRIKAIQTSNPNKVEIVTTNLVSNPENLEAELHHWLQEYKANGGQEWFMLTDKQALELAIKLNNTQSVNLSDSIMLQDIVIKQDYMDHQIDKVLDFLKLKIVDKYNPNNFIMGNPAIPRSTRGHRDKPNLTNYELIKKAKDIFKQDGKASTSLLQRKLSIGYGRASRIMDELENQGAIGKADGTNKPRKVLI